MVNTEIRLIIFFAATDGDAPYSQQKQDRELIVAQIMNSLLQKFRLKWKKVGKTTRPLRYQFNSVQFNHSEVSDSLWPHGLQHARPPCPLPTHRVYSNSCPLIRWCHPTISSSVIPSPPTFNLSQHQGLFHSSQFFASGDQSTGVSASPSVFPMNIQDWFPSVWPKSNPLWLFSGSDK